MTKDSGVTCLRYWYMVVFAWDMETDTQFFMWGETLL
jgi:hypothetical protein